MWDRIGEARRRVVSVGVLGGLIVALVGCCTCSERASAEEISVQATVSHRSVPVNGRLQLTLQVNGTQNVQPPAIELEDCDVQYNGPSTQISVVNGRVFSSIAHIYTLIPQREGTLTIDPIAVEADGKRFETEPIEVEVLSASASPQRVPSRLTPTEPAPGRPAIGDALKLQLGLDTARAYLNQAIPVRLQLLVGNVAVRGIKMPTLQTDGFLVRPMGQPTQSNVIAGGQRYTLLEFGTVIVPITTGQLSLGPASIDCQIVQRRRTARRPGPFGTDPFEEFFGGGSFFEEFFGRATVYPVTVSAEPLVLEVLPLPKEGQPEDFAGAIGHFTLEADVVPTEVAVGDPVTITMTLRGDGNFESVSAPTFAEALDQFKVYEPQQQSASTDPAEPQRKVFEQVLIPRDVSVKEIPPIRFSYLDPDRGRYETLTHGPVPLQVTPSLIQGRASLVGQSMEPEVLGRDIVYIKEQVGSLRRPGWTWYRYPWWLFWYAGAVVALAMSEWLRRRAAWRLANPAAARASGAMKRAWGHCQRARKFNTGQKVRECYEEIFRALQGYVGDRLNLSSGALTKAELEQHLRSRGAPEELVRELSELFDRCDAARFAPESVASDQMDATIDTAESILKRYEAWGPA